MAEGIMLDARLDAIAQWIRPGDTCADIGCDHGRLDAWLLQRGILKRAILIDISDASLNKARTLMALLGLTDRVRYIVSDGAMALDEPADCVVIAGMGGKTISDILSRDSERIRGARWILQPNVEAETVRQTLETLDYQIVDEKVVRDGRRHYLILLAQPGEMHLNDCERTVGPILLKKRPESLYSYRNFRLCVLERAIEGALWGKDDTAIQKLTDEKSIWEALTDER